jgi:protocatechuate 3,4-dioxygenase, alpha subunit
VTDEDALIATASQTVGPFFHLGLTPQPNGRLVDRLQGAEPITLVVRVTDGDGQPVADAAVEIMQDGVFGRMATGDDGTCMFETVRSPSSTPNGAGARAPHISVWLFARGLLRHLHTRIYFAGDPASDADPVLALVPEHRRATLLAHADGTRPGVWVFGLRLQGEGETVFFDD